MWLYKIFGSFDSALIIYPNELSKAAQLLLAKAKSFKETNGNYTRVRTSIRS
ncbi:unnamed protein product [Brassica oleracea]